MFLVFAGFFEVVWAVSLKYSNGFTRLWPSIIVIVGGLLSFLLLSLAVKELPVGTAYAVWTGLGVIGTVILGMILFDEPHDILRLIAFLLILSGITMLRIVSKQ